MSVLPANPDHMLSFAGPFVFLNSSANKGKFLYLDSEGLQTLNVNLDAQNILSCESCHAWQDCKQSGGSLAIDGKINQIGVFCYENEQDLTRGIALGNSLIPTDACSVSLGDMNDIPQPDQDQSLEDYLAKYIGNLETTHSLVILLSLQDLFPTVSAISLKAVLSRFIERSEMKRQINYLEQKIQDLELKTETNLYCGPRLDAHPKKVVLGAYIMVGGHIYYGDFGNSGVEWSPVQIPTHKIIFFQTPEYLLKTTWESDGYYRFLKSKFTGKVYVRGLPYFYHHGVLVN